jgi:flavin reductase (DIM6/NTAB) family NADH-FMN oxidoreductase RutF
MFFEPHLRNHGLPHDPFNALVSPRPIGWISTRARDGRLNLAPYSYFNALASNPWLVMFSASHEKDSVVFAGESGEFVANLVSANLVEAMIASSIDAPRGVSEFEYAQLTPEPGTLVAAPRVKEAFAALECKVTEIWRPKSIHNSAHTPFVVCGEVVGIHIDDAIMTDGQVDMAKASPVSRLGYLDYAITSEVFSRARPRWRNMQG